MHSQLPKHSAILFAVTNQYSAALNLYLQAGAVCSDFFTKAVPPDVYTDQVSLLLHQPLHRRRSIVVNIVSTNGNHKNETRKRSLCVF